MKKLSSNQVTNRIGAVFNKKSILETAIIDNGLLFNRKDFKAFGNYRFKSGMKLSKYTY